MVYGRKRYRKKRFGKRKWKRPSIGKAVRKVLKEENVPRSVSYDATTAGYESAQNETELIAFEPIGTVSDMETFMEQTVVSTNDIGSGVVKAGQLFDPISASLLERPTGAQLTDGTLDKNERYLCEFRNYTEKYIIKNTELHPIDVTCYEVVATADRIRTGAASPNHDKANAIMMDDFTRLLRAGDIAPTTGDMDTVDDVKLSGDNIYDHSGNILRTAKHSISMSRCRGFSDFWKVDQAKKFRLHPGDEIQWGLKKIRYTFSPKKVYLDETVSSPETLEILRGVTRMLVVKIRGPLGRSAAANGHGDVGFMPAEIAVHKQKRATLLPYLAKKFPVHVDYIERDDLTSVTIQDVTEHTKVSGDGV